jgi:hypothetical protein
MDNQAVEPRRNNQAQNETLSLENIIMPSGIKIKNDGTGQLLIDNHLSLFVKQNISNP